MKKNKDKFTSKDLEQLEALLEMGATTITVKSNKIPALLKQFKTFKKAQNRKRRHTRWCNREMNAEPY